MATESGQPSGVMDAYVYDAAIHRRRRIENSQLKAALNSVTPGSRNTPLHLAASVGNLKFIQQFLQLNPPVVKATNAQGYTALHFAAQGGFSRVVEILLQSKESGVDVCNKHSETALFKACESGDLATMKQLLRAYPSSLRQRTVDDRTCLNVILNRGASDLLQHILDLLDAKELIKEKYKDGDTVLHIAAGRNYVHIIRQLVKFDAQLCHQVNDNQETPLCMAAKSGHLEAVKELIKLKPEAVEIPTKCGKNILHLTAQVSQVRIVDYLNKTVGLSELVNQRARLSNCPEEEDHLYSCTESMDSGGDTPLHIAVRNKNFHMVTSLLRIKGINKHVLNKEGLTALDIARETTEYHESHNIIAVLAGYPSKQKPFLYSAPKMSAEKYQNAISIVNKTYDDRRNSELVVAVLLATMSFTAVFTIPGGFQTESNKGETEKMLGSPILIGFDSFKLFLIFDILAFFLSLFVVLMWQMSTPITTGDKVLFLAVTNLLVCAAFAFTAYGFMAAVYTMLAHKVTTMAWIVLGACAVICVSGNLSFFYLATKFLVKMARFNQLRGVHPFVPDRVVECVWMKLESWGPLNMMRWSKTKCLALIYGDSLMETGSGESV
ncbi:hypothetical protein SUGI_0697480 [Cryptomeria japonica]|uniref:ankyrin repeat-containing protein ITN1 n=1 Tax=Cryptomeria japonica TaxID=3369 RepID=UPI002414C580|nr:ankyrin repeat-containing protein ITN1 [Cryptomeria japonica]GLJ34680.1 hypothetical protein SUGI_0697480 [Cryptomeria japonica]